MILTPKNFSKHLKLRIRYFFGKPYYVEKKSKIVRVTARSIWAGMPHVHSLFNKYCICILVPSHFKIFKITRGKWGRDAGV